MKIIKGDIVESISLDELNLIENGGILIDDEGTIKEVYEKIPENTKFEIIDYKGKLIMQSFCDMHIHAPQYPMVGTGMDLSLIDWLNTYTFKNEAKFKDVEFARKVYKNLAKDLISVGTTRVCMFSSLHTDATLVLMEELEKAGVTGFVGKVNMDRNSVPELSETTEESIKETERWLKECKRFKYVKPIITPRFTPSCTNELMEYLGKTAKENNLYVQSHLSENLDEIEWVKSLHPDTTDYWETYAKYGLWKPKTLMAHCVHSKMNERNAIKDNGVIVVHCPDSNINLSSGTCPVRYYLNEGIKVVLGSDIAGGSLLAMNRNIQVAIKASKVNHITSKYKDPFLTVNEGYYLATSAAQTYFEGGVGFEKDKKLHCIVVDDSLFPLPAKKLTLQERFERAIYLMEKDSIIAVYSEGRKVK